MRWIDRGSEPAEIAVMAEEHTQGWIDYYTIRAPNGNSIYPKPEDHGWSYNRETLGLQSNGNCWYCERRCQPIGGLTPTVDHFKPRHLCPILTYDWSNWVYSCRRCNVENKDGKWPETGYVDPCAADAKERPDQYFDYDELSGRLKPKDGLSSEGTRRTENTINDLGLGKVDIVNPRFSSVRKFQIDFVAELIDYSQDVLCEFIENFLALPACDRIEFLISSEISNGRDIEYIGVKAIVAEKLLRERRRNF